MVIIPLLCWQSQQDIASFSFVASITLSGSSLSALTGPVPTEVEDLTDKDAVSCTNLSNT